MPYQPHAPISLASTAISESEFDSYPRIGGFRAAVSLRPCCRHVSVDVFLIGTIRGVAVVEGTPGAGAGVRVIPEVNPRTVSAQSRGRGR